MRRTTLLLLALTVACSGSVEPVPSTSVEPSVTVGPTVTTTTATSTPATDATSIPPTTTSTLAIDDTVLAYQPIAELPFPVQVTARPGDSLAYVITKDGRVWLLDGAAVAEQPVLDISGQVRDSGEQGLLSIALHPSDQSLIYLHYSDGNGNTVISEFVLASSDLADPASERVLLEVDQPAGNHNGGMIQFAPDGALILGLGDGGGGGDRYGNGQNPDTLLGGLVTIDVSGEEPNATKFAMGLRNPWRFWIDGPTLFVADVGQNAYEEINAVALAPGLNFGWPIAEGLTCYSPASGCDTSGQVIPIHAVEHGDAGTCSITGGVVYRGSALPQLSGHYFYSDYCGGYLRSLLTSDGGAVELRDWTGQVGVPGQVTGFGVDGAGEMYVTTTDQLLKVITVD